MYKSYEDSEAYAKGRSDARRGYCDHSYDEHAIEGVDKSYHDGIRDYERESQRRAELLAEEEQREMDRQYRLQQQHEEALRQQMEEEQIAEYQREQERKYYEQLEHEANKLNGL